MIVARLVLGLQLPLMDPKSEMVGQIYIVSKRCPIPTNRCTRNVVRTWSRRLRDHEYRHGSHRGGFLDDL